MQKSTDAVTSLINTLSSHYPLSVSVQTYLAKQTKPIIVRRGKYLLKAGAVCEHVYFIYQGLLRGFVVQNGRQITTWINAENELVSSISGLSEQAASFENIQAIEESNLLALHFEDLEKLYRLHPDFNIPIRMLLQKYYADADRRAIVARLPGSIAKYEYFLNGFPQIANRVPMKYIASFLGIKQETLSRIRKQIAEKNIDKCQKKHKVNS